MLHTPKCDAASYVQLVSILPSKHFTRFLMLLPLLQLLL